MSVHHIDDIREYVAYLQTSEREVDILFRELLIGVTNFFRDANAYDTLKNTILPQLLADKPEDYTIRVWVSGCSSGEEAYSLAIILKEYMYEHKVHFNVQIFGTDIDEEAINRARLGLYPPSINNDVSAQRLKWFFSTEDNGHYRIRKNIREMLVFAPQSIIKDPPFTRLDILSCRNLLIYLGVELQRKLLPVFHYSLKPGGILFLGSSETIDQSKGLFTVLDKKWKIFRKSPAKTSPRPLLHFPVSGNTDYKTRPRMEENTNKMNEVSALQLVETILHQTDAPPCVIIDDDNNGIYIHGKTGHFLEPAEGRVSVNILHMARPGLRAPLSDAIKRAAMHKQEIITHDLQIEHDDALIVIDLIVRPVHERTQLRGLMMVIFEEKTQPPGKRGRKEPKPVNASRSAQDIEKELIETRENLQTTIEELQAANEELKSTNEELQSTNEELQSTNEEMETSKEELQSLNEESVTVNAELQSRIEELSKSNDDLKNLMDSTNIATIFLDTDLCVRRYTPRTQEIIPLTANDIGRPIKHFATSLIEVDITETGKKVLQELIPQAVEVQSRDGHDYAMSVRPYRTVNNVIDGVVVTLDDITERKQSEIALLQSEARYRMLFDISNDSIVLIDARSLKIVECNNNTLSRLGFTREEVIKRKLSDITYPTGENDLSLQLKKAVESGSHEFNARLESKKGDITDVHVRAKTIEFIDNAFILASWTHA